MARISDPIVRAALIDSAARLLTAHGPDAVSTRRVASEAQTSSMAVYTHFGSIAGLIAGVIDDGFARLAAQLGRVAATDDPVRDLVALLNTNAEFARREPNLYQVMLGTAALGQYRRTTPDELRTGQGGTLQLAVDACERAIAAGRFNPGDSKLIAHQWWGAIHGYIMLELAGFVHPTPGPPKVLRPMLETMAVGLGDTREAAAASITAAFEQASAISPDRDQSADTAQRRDATSDGDRETA